MNRRGFLAGLIAAPAVVAAGSLMPIRLPSVLRPRVHDLIDVSYQGGTTITIEPSLRGFNVGDVVTIENVKNLTSVYSRQFVVTARNNPGERVLCLYPPIVGAEELTRQNVDRHPMRGAKIEVVSPALPFRFVESVLPAPDFRSSRYDYEYISPQYFSA